MHAVFKMGFPCSSEAILSLKYCASIFPSGKEWNIRKSAQRLARHIVTQTLLAWHLRCCRVFSYFAVRGMVRIKTLPSLIITLWPYVYSVNAICTNLHALLNNNAGQICLQTKFSFLRAGCLPSKSHAALHFTFAAWFHLLHNGQ